MSAFSALLSAAIWASAWSGLQADRAEAKPQIPSALHGCWELREPPDDEFPDGLSKTLTVAADRIIIDAKGVSRQVGNIEEVQRLTPRLIEGRISAPDKHGSSTLATMLELDPEGAPAGTLLLREGDAGSYHFLRCGAEAESAQRFSLVIAETAKQDDPLPAPCGPNGDCNDFLYRSEFREARVIAGGDLPTRFEARLKLHTPYISHYRLALIVERLKDGSLLVRRQAGFNGRNGLACFNEPGEWPVDWRPEQVSQVHYDREILCVLDKDQIDPDAPKD